MPKDTYLRKVLGEDKRRQLQTSTVLMVGAGGIGCELLKDLMLSGYGNIHIVDLDTITLSNLNRQFLFRQHDIDKSKSLTIKHAVQKFNYHATNLVSHHGNIMDTRQFPIEWWNQFDYIFNALDNLEARRYVNKMALFASKPVMESGTTGYDGYVQPIFPYRTECFDCQPKATPKTFPVCTIRSTPSKPIHCITWAKEFLFTQLFDEHQKQTDELSGATDNKQELDNLLRETNELADLKGLVSAGSAGFVREMFRKIFIVDIKRLGEIDTLWKNRTKPTPLSMDLFEATSADKDLLLDDTAVWDVAENIHTLVSSAARLQLRLASKSEPFVSFDKDDEDTLRFVSAAANLRCHIFEIPTLSQFDIKQIAGNIIPAIATTNAIISGLSNLESLNYLRGNDRSAAAMVFISIRPNKYATSASLEGPRAQCPTCSVARGIVTIPANASPTLEELVERVKAQYGYESIALIVGKSRLVYDSDFDDNLPKTVAALGITEGEIIQIQDEDDELETLELLVDVSGEKLVLPERELKPKPVAETKPAEGENADESQAENGDLVVHNQGFDTIVIDDDVVAEPEQKKRRVV